jgi:hypothetical protein
MIDLKKSVTRIFLRMYVHSLMKVSKARKMKQASRSPSPTTNDSGITNQELLTAKYAAASALNTSRKVSDDIMKRKRIGELALSRMDYSKKRCEIGKNIKQMKQHGTYNSDEKKRLKDEKHELKILLRYNEIESEKLKKELKLYEVDVSESSSDSD